MQILPLATARAAAAQNTALSGSLETGRQSSLFASLFDSARADTTAGTSATTGTLLDTSSASIASSDTQTPSNDDLMNLRLTAEDLASLRDNLKNQGFSDDDMAALDAKVNSESGMTWGELYKEVEKKISNTGDSTKKKDVSNEDTVELMGLFGKLGFTTEQSQQMLDSLAKGDSQSVLSAIDAKVAGLAADDSVSLTTSEMTSLGRTLGLSDEAQGRLAALFNQSDAASGLSGQGLTTAFATVKNELLAKIGEQNQAMEQFRQAASDALDNAWMRQTGKLNAGLHNDDVARKAAQVVAMNDDKQAESGTVPTAAKAGIDTLADVPVAGQGLGGDASGKPATASQAVTADKGALAELHNRAGAVAAEQAALAGESSSGATQAGTGQATTAVHAGETAVAGLRGLATEPAAATELHSRAGAVAAEQAGLADQGTQGQTASKHASTAVSSQNGLAGQAFGNGADTAGQQAGGNTGGFSGQSGQESAMGDLLGKMHTDKTTGRTTGASATSLTQTMAAMDAVTGSGAGQAGKSADPALAARVARQVETGLLRTVGQDAKQLTLNLTPDELGKLSITVTVKDKEVKAVITADNADTAAMLNDQAAKIKQTLEGQGFKVTKLEVQTGVAGGDQNAWQGTQQHNEAWQQREAVDRGWTSQRLARASLGDPGNAQSGFVPPTISGQADGLDLFA